MTKRKAKAKLPVLTIKNPKLKRVALLSSLGVVGVLALVCVGLGSYTIRYKDKIYPNVMVGTVDFGGKTTKQAEETLIQMAQPHEKGLVVYLNDEKIDSVILPKDLHLEYHPAQTARELVKHGRSGNLVADLWNIARSLVTSTSIPAEYTVDEALMLKHVSDLAKKYGSTAQDAKVVLRDDGSVGIESAKEGFGMHADEVATKLRASIQTLAPEVRVASQTIQPTIRDNQAEQARAATEAIIAKAPVTLSADGESVTADAKKVFSWLTYEAVALEESSSPSPAVPSAWTQYIPEVKAKNSEKILKTTVNKDRVKDFIANFAITVNEDPSNAELRAVEGTIKVVKEHVDGKKVKLDDATNQVVTALQESGTTTSPLMVAIPLEIAEATVKATNIEQLGIKELIGRAETTFKGSPANRIHNINTGSGFLNGEIVGPGQEFSTVKTLGKVDGSTGYLPELVIKENRTIPEFGGGLCQVSTTLFRSVLNAGLKVTERHNHSYRVSYYEPPIGLDATIYLPRPDFKFLNDTPGYILVQSKVEGTKITFELYGTKDGRSASISEPVITDVTDPPAPIYTDTDTLPKGETKQIEKPHPGARASVTYTVTRDGKEINKQVFRSNYKAWPARFLVGTRE